MKKPATHLSSFFVRLSLFVFLYSAFLRYAKYPYLIQQASYKINQRGVIKLSKNLLITYLIIFLAFSSVTGLFLFNPFGTKETHAAWFNDSWAYRKEVPITANASADTNAFFSFSLDTATLITNGQLQSGCQDIRVTDASGNVLQYHVGRTNACNNAATTIDVLPPYAPNSSTPTLPAGASTYYVYYGNPSVTSKDIGANFTQSEAASYTVGTLGSEVKGPSPLVYWKFDEGQGSIANSINTPGNAVTIEFVQSKTAEVTCLEDPGNDGTRTITFDSTPKAGSLIIVAVSTWQAGGVPHSSVTQTGNTFTKIAEAGAGADNDISLWYAQNNNASTNTITVDTSGCPDSDIAILEYTGVATSGALDQFNTNTGTTASNASTGSVTSTTDGQLYIGAIAHNGSTTTQTADAPFTMRASVPEGNDGMPIAVSDYGTGSTTVQAGTYSATFDFGASREYEAVIASFKRASHASANQFLGSISGAAWRTEDNCVAGKCLYFDGNNDSVSAGDSGVIDFAAADNFTVSAWVKRNGASSANTVILSKASGNLGATYQGYKLYMDASGDLCFATRDGTNAEDSACTSAVDFDDSQWHFVSGVKNGTSSITLYVDGIQRAQDSSIASTGSLANSGSLYVGIDQDGSSNDWLGFIDEVKVFKDQTARTADQIKADYNARSNPEGAAMQTANTQNLPGALSNGLVGYWKMDESSGNASDSSGNGYTLTNTNTVTYIGGKFGNAANLAASSSQRFTIASNSDLVIGNSSKTFTAWVKLNSKTTDRHIFGKWTTGSTNNEYGLFYSSSADRFRFEVTTDGNNSNIVGAVADSLGSPSTGVWYFVVGTYNNATGTVSIQVNNGPVDSTSGASTAFSGSNNLTVGALRNSSATNFWDGNIDEARIYNRALSLSEVSQLYNWAPGPLAIWKMEEGSGGFIEDTSGSNNRGTNSNTTWTTGKYGSGLSFNGTSSGVAISNESNFDFERTTNFTIEAWIKTSSTSNQGIFSKLDSSSPNSGFELGILSNVLRFALVNTVSTNWLVVDGSTTVTDGNWHHVAVSYSGTSSPSGVAIYVDGKAETLSTVGNNLSASTLNNITPRIGNRNNAQTFFNGSIDQVQIYKYARTSAQIVEDMNAGHPTPGSPVGTPVGWWKFNEGADNTCSGGTHDVCNSGNGGSTYDGTSTASRTNAGRFGRALEFDGSDDVVTITNNTAIDMDGNLANFTFSAWVYADSDGESDTGQIFSKGSSTYLRIDSQDGSDNLDLECNLDRATTDTNVNVADAFKTASWNYVACSWDGTTLSVFVNGQLRGSSNSGSGAISSDSNNLLIGGGTSNNFDGKIDEFKVYSSALTAAQTTLDMNQGSAQVMGALSDNAAGQTGTTSTSANQEYCIPSDISTCTAPVGRWDFEEGSGSTAFDTSGNGNNGTLVQGPVYALGKIGKGIDFDGTDSVIDAGTGIALQSAATVTGWYRSDGTGSGNAHTIFSNSEAADQQNLHFEVNRGDANLLSVIWGDTVILTGNTDIVTDQKWHHVAVTRSGSSGSWTVRFYVDGKLDASTTTSTNPNGGSSPRTCIGALVNGANENCNTALLPLGGLLDNIKAFNYALTPAQIVWDYNRGAPIAHWKMDECQGTTINDSSGNGLTGTLTNATAGTCSTSSSAWGNGVSGKRNYSLDFDGSDDIISVSDSDKISIDSGLSQGFTFAAWIYPNSDGETDVGEIFDKGTNTYCRTDSDDGTFVDIECRVDLDTDAAFNVADACRLNQWCHVAFSWTNDADDEVTIWINGLPNTSTATFSGNGAADSNALTIGGTPNFDGQIDDFRIYNYELTASQIKTLINEGSTRFGPTSGAP